MSTYSLLAVIYVVSVGAAIILIMRGATLSKSHRNAQIAFAVLLPFAGSLIAIVIHLADRSRGEITPENKTWWGFWMFAPNVPSNDADCGLRIERWR